MTNEEKQAFFAQYWGQKACVCNDGFIRTIGVTCDVSDIEYLKLRTVDQLTASELLDLSMKGNHEDYIDFTSLIQPESDYLRSIGVLVGFRHFTPEMLIAEGAVKIKEV